jgi:hypothetical protein
MRVLFMSDQLPSSNWSVAPASGLWNWSESRSLRLYCSSDRRRAAASAFSAHLDTRLRREFHGLGPGIEHRLAVIFLAVDFVGDAGGQLAPFR